MKVAEEMTMPCPTTFSDEPINLAQVTLDQQATEAIGRLEQSGFEVTAGLQLADIPFITEISKQNAVREFCPNDLTKRFGDRGMIERWLQKDGGRAVFLLRDIETKVIRGFGWAGLKQCDELPDYAATFGVRLDERVSGRGLGRPFIMAIFSGSRVLYGITGIWGETWGSNVGAVKTYLRIGAEVVSTTDDWRETIESGTGVVEGKRQDVRLLLKFPDTL